MMQDTNKNIAKGNQLWLVTLFAVALFTIMFIFKQAGGFDFWYWMSSNLVILLSLVFILDHSNGLEIRNDLKDGLLRKVVMGIVAAVSLFIVFYVGNILIRYIFEQAGQGIENVYAFKQEASPLRIALLMLIIIGPGEELFWRGYLQRKLGLRFGKMNGLIFATALYTIVHVATGNLVLVLAALICGIFWGWLYMRYRSMTINIISHTVWDVGVFILLPFTA